VFALNIIDRIRPCVKAAGSVNVLQLVESVCVSLEWILKILGLLENIIQLLTETITHADIC